MEKRGKVLIKWSPEFAYALGLLVTDGSLSSDGRHIDFTSREKEQIVTFMKCLGIVNIKIGHKTSGYTKKKQLRIQFGDVHLYKFLLSIGLMPAKTKIISKIDVPQKYFFDFLRGHFDGDGTFYSYWDKRWKRSFMFYTELMSASEKHILWLRETTHSLIGIRGHVTRSKNNSVIQLKYGKGESLKLLQEMYYSDDVVCLERKRYKVERALKRNITARVL